MMEKAWNWIVARKSDIHWKSSNASFGAVTDPPAKLAIRGHKYRATKLQKIMNKTSCPEILPDQLMTKNNNDNKGWNSDEIGVEIEKSAENGTTVKTEEESSPKLKVLRKQDSEKRKVRVTFDTNSEIRNNDGKAIIAPTKGDSDDFESFFEESQSAINEALRERLISTESDCPRPNSPSFRLLASARLSIDEAYPEGLPDSEWNHPLIEQLKSDTSMGRARREPFTVAVHNEGNVIVSNILPAVEESDHEDEAEEQDQPSCSTDHEKIAENCDKYHSIRSTSTCSTDQRRHSLAVRRKSNIQSVQKITNRRSSSTTVIPLTSAQILMVRSVWNQIYTSKGPTVLGSIIFHKLFFKSAEIKDSFRKLPVHMHHPNRESFMKAHYKGLADLVDSVVGNLEHLESVTEELEKVGRCHALAFGTGLPTRFWNSLAETFIDCTLEWGDKRGRSENVRKAWALIIAFIVEKIKAGHVLERRKNSSITFEGVPPIKINYCP